MPPADRNTSETTQQMLAAAWHAVYIWPEAGSKAYAVYLARYLKRYDLEIVTPDWITNQRWLGRELTGIVLDHAARLTEEECVMLACARARVRKP